MVASVPREKEMRCATKSAPQAIATHCTQKRSGEKRRLSTAQMSRPEIINSAWAVSSARCCSRAMNPLLGPLLGTADFYRECGPAE